MDAADTSPPSHTIVPAKRSKRSKAPANLDKIQAQYQAGKTTRELGQQYGVAHTTIQRWLDANQHQSQGVQQFKAHRADILARVQAKALSLQEQLIDSLAEDGLRNVLTPHQKTGALAVLVNVNGNAYDKERLETGQSTQNTSILSQMVDSQVSTLYQRALKVASPSRAREISKPAAAPADSGPGGPGGMGENSVTAATSPPTQS